MTKFFCLVGVLMLLALAIYLPYEYLAYRAAAFVLAALVSIYSALHTTQNRHD